MLFKDLKSKLKNNLPRNKFSRGVSFLVGGNISSLFATLLAAPILTRLYEPKDFANLAIYISCVALVNVISGLRYELAIPIADNQNDANNLTFLSFLINILISIIFGFIAWPILLYNPFFSLPFQFYILCTLGILSGGFYKTIRYWAIRNKKFPEIASNRFQQIILTILIQLLCYKFGGAGLIYGNLFGFIFAAFALINSLYKIFDLGVIRINNLIEVGVSYRRFPFYSSFSGLSSTAGLRLPPILFSHFFGPLNTGLYALSDRIMTLPMSLIGASIAQVFRIHGLDAKKEGNLTRLVNNLHFVLAQFSLPIMALILLTGPDLFGLIFGAKWRESGAIASILSPWVYLALLTSPLSSLFGINKQEKKSFRFHLITLITRLLAIALGIKSGDFMTTLIYFSVAGIITRIFLLYTLTEKYNNGILDILKPTYEAILPSVLILTPLLVYYSEVFSYSNFSYIICLSFTIIFLLFRIYSLRNLLERL